jgi:hypothetical protein
MPSLPEAFRHETAVGAVERALELGRSRAGAEDLTFKDTRG